MESTRGAIHFCLLHRLRNTDVYRSLRDINGEKPVLWSWVNLVVKGVEGTGWSYHRRTAKQNLHFNSVSEINLYLGNFIYISVRLLYFVRRNLFVRILRFPFVCYTMTVSTTVISVCIRLATTGVRLPTPTPGPWTLPKEKWRGPSREKGRTGTVFRFFFVSARLTECGY